jgi:SpoVK/Ycf46/Vps4 family AAA+-type ATPase
VKHTSTSTQVAEQLDALIRARVTAIGVESYEEARVERILGDIAAERNKALVIWTATSGFTIRNPQAIGAPYLPATEDDEQAPLFDLQTALLAVPTRTERTASYNEQTGSATFESTVEAIYIFKDTHHFLGDAVPLRAIRDLCRMLVPTRKTLVLLSPVMHAPNATTLPADLEKEITVVRFPLPNKSELRVIVETAAKSKKVPINLTPTLVEELSEALRGLTQSEAESTIRQAMITNGDLGASAIGTILQEKDQIVAKANILEPVPETVEPSDIGGVELFKEYMLEVEANSTPEALKFFGRDEDRPKGVLAIGFPGTGKSTLAKVGSKKQRVYRLDISRVLGGIVGQSEHNLSAALRVAEAMGVRLWIDEIEKLFGSQGMNGGSSNGSIENNLLGILLTWMQEQNTCYIFATANDIRPLKGELLRRFDDIYFVDLPTHAELVSILSVHLRKRQRDPKKFDLVRVASAIPGYTGAEAEKVVKKAISNARAAGRDVNTDDLVAAKAKVVPIVRTQREQIDELRAAMQGRALPASLPEVQQTGAVLAGSKPQVPFDVYDIEVA